jgi:general secretion pathway protein L
MTRQLTLYFDSPDAEKAVGYQLTDGQQTLATGSATLADLHSDVLSELASKPAETIIVIPGDQVTSLRKTAPKGSRRHLAQALPFLLEDELAAPVENLHLVYSKTPDAEGKLLCAVIDKSVIAKYLEVLSNHDITVDRLIPDYWTIPVADKLQLFKKDLSLLIRSPTGEGMSVPASINPALLAVLFPALDKTQLVDVPLWQPAPTTLAPLNLLQGDYAPVHSSVHFHIVKPVVIAASACLAIFVGYFFIAGWLFDGRAAQLMQQSENRYRELFPDDTRIVDIRRQMQVHLQSSKHDDGKSLFFDLLGAFAAAKKSQTEDATVRNIRFEQDRGTLQLELQSRSINYANNIQNYLQTAGMSAEVLSASSDNEGVVTHLQVRTGDKP